MRIGLDVGSTTLKCVVLDEGGNILHKTYERHLSQIAEKTARMLGEIQLRFPETAACPICISGSAGMGLAESLSIPFTQEVFATRVAVRKLCLDTDTVIELGGEDAKILFLGRAAEVRMNGSCAGGTGAFIDQMATLLNVTPETLNVLASRREKLYSIASRCGVFAKSDIQALLNQGATKEDIAASIFYAVVNQTVAGLAQGREIGGKLLYLGGPLTFLPELRAAFGDVLKTSGVLPENSLYFVAYGAALTPDLKALPILETAEKIKRYTAGDGFLRCAPLFRDEAEYEEFTARHSAGAAPACQLPTAACQPSTVWLGVDAGSTTAKCVAVNEGGGIVFSRYISNAGNPVPVVRRFLEEFYADFPDAKISGAASTGYGEEIIKNAFKLDLGVVETIAHFTAARAFDPDVDFILDIGGQDIKCFKIRNGAIDNIFLNEACSSGCGSFLQSFAGALGYSPEEFSRLGLFSPAPVDLGSRCTVFMNSSVKQAQKDGANIEAISVGLSISVVKNALYKVIRAARPEQLGEHIVVQGGTFLNDAVLRSFEQETGREVTRPAVAGLMGALGAALYAKEHFHSANSSAIIDREGLENFRHEVRSVTCKACGNRCALTVNTFDGGRKFIAGNRCERPVTGRAPGRRLNIYDCKRELLKAYGETEGERGTIGLPMVLNMFEMLPFWHTFFTALNFGVLTSGESDRKLYFEGQHTIPSDTVCYPAKLVHGHMERLLTKFAQRRMERAMKSNADAVFYPCLSYNFDEGRGDNHFNCPVVAYYPEVIAANLHFAGEPQFIYDYVGIHRREDFPGKMQKILSKYFPKIPLKEIKRASDAAYAEYEAHMERIRAKGRELLESARERQMPVILLAGRPYHLDREVCHDIDSLICDLGAAVLCEDSMCGYAEKFETTVLNQWTYHARMYSAAKYVAQSGDLDMNLVQLVSFGCGVDAVTTDEVRAILEGGDRIYTQIKIDELTNLGAVKIRLRSLFAAVERKKRRAV